MIDVALDYFEKHALPGDDSVPTDGSSVGGGPKTRNARSGSSSVARKAGTTGAGVRRRSNEPPSCDVREDDGSVPAPDLASATVDEQIEFAMAQFREENPGMADPKVVSWDEFMGWVDELAKARRKAGITDAAGHEYETRDDGRRYCRACGVPEEAGTEAEE